MLSLEGSPNENQRYKFEIVGVIIDTLLLSVDAAATLLGVGRSHFYGLHSSGRLGPMPIRLGRRTFWSQKELEEWVKCGCPGRQQWIQRNVDNGV